MKHFTIENETRNITVHASPREAEVVPNSERFASESALAKLTGGWPMARLTELWNSLPGVTPVSRFKDRAAALARIWKAIQNLDVAAPGFIAEPEVRPATAGTPAGGNTVPDAVATRVAPQGAHVAPEASPAENAATQAPGTPAESVIDRNECERLLKIAVTTQRAYWNALGALEKVVRFEMDDPGDLDNTTVDELLERRQVSPKKLRRAATSPRAPRENSKTNQVIALLKRPEGTTVEEIMTAMRWQKHTTRALLSVGGALVKKHGLVITTATVGDTRRYYIRD